MLEQPVTFNKIVQSLQFYTKELRQTKKGLLWDDWEALGVTKWSSPYTVFNLRKTESCLRKNLRGIYSTGLKSFPYETYFLYYRYELYRHSHLCSVRSNKVVAAALLRMVLFNRNSKKRGLNQTKSGPYHHLC